MSMVARQAEAAVGAVVEVKAAAMAVGGQASAAAPLRRRRRRRRRVVVVVAGVVAGVEEVGAEESELCNGPEESTVTVSKMDEWIF